MIFDNSGNRFSGIRPLRDQIGLELTKRPKHSCINLNLHMACVSGDPLPLRQLRIFVIWEGSEIRTKMLFRAQTLILGARSPLAGSDR